MSILPTGTTTFLFSDIQGSTRLWEAHPDGMRRALARHDALLHDVFRAEGGEVFKTAGDSVFAAFPCVPSALRAALRAQAALHAEPWPLPDGEAVRVRLALHTGAAEGRDGDYFGPALGRTARLLAAAHGGQTLVSEDAAGAAGDSLPPEAALRSLGRHRLKDLAQPQEIFQLAHPALPDSFPPLRSLESFAHNLPGQLTSFVGREREMAEARRLLSRSRLLTLSGPGGAGKTRLALQVAADALDEFADGAWLTELAPLSDPALVGQTVAAVLGVREEPGRALALTLADALRLKSCLLILDNCEHLVDACAHLAESLLRTCPGLRILATSREALEIGGEAVLSLSSLSLPDPARSPSEMAAGSEAVRLFVDRARSALPGFGLDGENAPSVALICARLDGIPLLLELAAARVRVLSPVQIADRLDDRFRLLSGGSRTAPSRQQTLRALLDWSYDLLAPSEQTLLRRLSAFGGGWSLEAAEAVCAGGSLDDWEILDLLSHLVAKSLVMVEPPQDGHVRYRLLENIRTYAHARLVETAEGAALSVKHRAWFLALAEQAAPALTGPEQALWLNRLETDHDNLRCALETSHDAPDGAEAELRLVGSLWRFWHVRGYLSEARRRFDAALSRQNEAPPEVRAQALTGAGILAWAQRDYPAAQQFYGNALTLWQMSHNRAKEAAILNNLGMVAEYTGDYAAARPYYEDSLAIAEELNETSRVALALGNLGALALTQKNYELSETLLSKSLLLRQEMGDEYGVASTLYNLGVVASRQDKHEAAQLFYQQSLIGRHKLKDVTGTIHSLAVLGFACCRLKEYAKSACLLGALTTAIQLNHIPLLQEHQEEYEIRLSDVRAGLGDDAMGEAWQRGEAMTLEEAVHYALDAERREEETR